ncbi:hypothetical protein NJ76_28185, partial [Rhodococcus sp. IITR03]
MGQRPDRRWRITAMTTTRIAITPTGATRVATDPFAYCMRSSGSASGCGGAAGEGVVDGVGGVEVIVGAGEALTGLGGTDSFGRACAESSSPG